MGFQLLRRLAAYLTGESAGSGTVFGPIWKDAEEYMVVRRSDWEALKRENEELRRENEELRQENAELRRQLAQALGKIEVLTARVAELEERLRMSSGNSSKPPSSDPPWAKPKPKRAKGKRKRGAQQGHEGKARSLLPPEEVDSFVDCAPPVGCDCGGQVEATGEVVETRQVVELPKVKPLVTEYHIIEGVCSKCGKHHRGSTPAGVPTGVLGPRAMALVAVLAGKYRMSKRYVVELLRDLFGLGLSLGTVSNTEARVSEAVAEPVDEAEEHARAQAVGHMDETGFRMGKLKSWLWVLATKLVTVFAIRFSRSTAVAKEMLGEKYQGILVSDRWSAYNWVDTSRRQLCWAHLLRDFTKISERRGASKTIGDALLGHARKMFSLWHQVRDGPLTRADFQAKMVPIRQAIENLIGEGVDCGHAKTSRTCKKLLAVKVALWTFVDTKGVEPTNNFGERTIRAGVMWRKVSFGTQSERGNRFVERMLSVAATCRQQGRNVLDFVAEAVEAKLNRMPAPSLLPAQPAAHQPTSSSQDMSAAA